MVLAVMVVCEIEHRRWCLLGRVGYLARNCDRVDPDGDGGTMRVWNQDAACCQSWRALSRYSHGGSPELLSPAMTLGVMVAATVVVMAVLTVAVPVSGVSMVAVAEGGEGVLKTTPMQVAKRRISKQEERRLLTMQPASPNSRTMPSTSGRPLEGFPRPSASPSGSDTSRISPRSLCTHSPVWKALGTAISFPGGIRTC